MATKKFINSIDNVVHESLSGFCSTYPQLDYHPSKRVVLSPQWNDTGKGNKVSLICGGGSGHEPFAAGFVGRRMLDASIAGDVFAAPPPNHILHALKCVTGTAGTLTIIPNYTGDCLNFGIAIEKAKQQFLKVSEIVVDDDCSILDNELGRAGKRGLIGMLFVIKIAGAIAERGDSLKEVHNHAEIVVANIATYGVGLRACSLPGQGPMFQLPDDEIEIGLGVHGEAGYDRVKIRKADEIVAIMLRRISNTLSLLPGDSVAVIVNNFGASSQLEQGIVINEVVSQLRTMDVSPVRIYSGVLMTSLDSAGIHVSILKLPQQYKELYVECLDAATDAPCWPGCAYSSASKSKTELIDEKRQTISQIGQKLNSSGARILEECLKSACKSIIANEEKLNSLDRGCGDGDCGSTHKKLADGILGTFDSLETSYPSSLLTQLSWIAEECMGGTSGAVYSLMFITAASALSKNDQKENNWGNLWALAWQSGIEGIMKYSKARPGDRTMLDSLTSALDSFRESITTNIPYEEAIEKAAEAARDGCEATKTMIPKAGRAAYVKQSEYLNDVDAGAFAVVVWLSAISEVCGNKS